MEVLGNLWKILFWVYRFGFEEEISGFLLEIVRVVLSGKMRILASMVIER